VSRYEPRFGIEERALVARLRAGDEAAFQELFDGWFLRLYRFALRRVDGDSDLAKEVAQEAFCTAFDKLGGFRGEAPLFTWLCAICRSEISRHFRRQRRMQPFEDPGERGRADTAATELAALPASGDDPEDLLLRDERAWQVHETIDRLPFHYGRALEWKYGEGLSVEEIGVRLGTTTKAAESLLTRARAAFRKGFVGIGGRLPSPSRCSEG
jgi:RNA polymerase sigma-70 factor (ECF subfamily)